MSDDIFARGLTHYRERLAIDFGCDVAALDSNQLTIVHRPAASAEEYIMLAVTLGTGTVVSADEAWVEFVRGLPLEKHFAAFQLQPMLGPVVDEARRREIDIVARSPNLGFLLGAPPTAPALPGGTRIERLDAIAYQPWIKQFHNALEGDPEELLFAIAILDERDRPVAVAGAWDESKGLIEIGVDVAREGRGQHLGTAIVQALAREILAQGAIPTYYCHPTNIRSHRTALSAGFVPVSSIAQVRLKKSPQASGQ